MCKARSSRSWSSWRSLGRARSVCKVLYAETGNIGENDVMLASASKAIIVGFNVQAEVAARRLAETEGVSIRLYDIIYRMTEDIEKALKGMLEPVEVEKVIGRRPCWRFSRPPSSDASPGAA